LPSRAASSQPPHSIAHSGGKCITSYHSLSSAHSPIFAAFADYGLLCSLPATRGAPYYFLSISRILLLSVEALRFQLPDLLASSLGTVHFLVWTGCLSMMSAFRRQDTLAYHCDIDNGVIILVACAIMTGLGCITLVARIYVRGWMTHSTDRDDYTMWAAGVRIRVLQLVSRWLMIIGFVRCWFRSYNP
jgi:hypothetical protein